MYQTIEKKMSEKDFVKEMELGGLTITIFTVEGLKAIYKYIEDTYMNYQFSIKSILKDFTEFKNFKTIQSNHTSIQSLVNLDEDRTVFDYLELDNGSLIIVN